MARLNKIMDENQTIIDNQFLKMREDFLNRLAEKFLQIDTALLAISEQGPTKQLRGVIAQLAHQTAGVAPTYGFTDIGAMASQVESVWTHEYSESRLREATALTETYLDSVEEIL